MTSQVSPEMYFSWPEMRSKKKKSWVFYRHAARASPSHKAKLRFARSVFWVRTDRHTDRQTENTSLWLEAPAATTSEVLSRLARLVSVVEGHLSSYHLSSWKLKSRFPAFPEVGSGNFIWRKDTPHFVTQSARSRNFSWKSPDGVFSNFKKIAWVFVVFPDIGGKFWKCHSMRHSISGRLYAGFFDKCSGSMKILRLNKSSHRKILKIWWKVDFFNTLEVKFVWQIDAHSSDL